MLIPMKNGKPGRLYGLVWCRNGGKDDEMVTKITNSS